MSNLGIKVVGQVTTKEELPDPLTYGGEFGDTFAVGNKAAVEQGLISYQYYVYTRASLTSGEPDNYWLNVGSISIVGPAGKTGAKGDTGKTGLSTRWIVVPGLPSSYGGEIRDHDMFLSTEGTQKGNVWQFTVEDGFTLMCNIMGQQGIPGPAGKTGAKGDTGKTGAKGDTGDAGGFINIAGILDSTSQLPTPASLGNLTIAYLIGENKELYIQVGSSSETAVWNNVGPINAATLVSSGGVYQNIWDADTKLDKRTDVTTTHSVYAKSADGTQQWLIGYSLGDTPSTIAQRTHTGALVVGTPTEDRHATTKAYVDNITANKLNAITGASTYNQAYVKTSLGVQTVFDISNDPIANSLCFRSSIGTLRVAEPVGTTDAATKGYVDSKVGGAIYNHHVTVGVNNYADIWEINFLSSSSTELSRNNFPEYIIGSIIYKGGGEQTEFAILTSISNASMTIQNFDGTIETLQISGGAQYSINQI